MPLKIGETFAGYRVLRRLGSGGMGEVYLVQHPRLPRQEALKVLRPDISSDTSFRERFIREADLAAGLRHPHIVGIHDRGEHDGRLWIAMDYVDGTDLAHQSAQRYPAGMPVDLALAVTAAIGSALDYAHKKGLLHRDVKPANIIAADLDTSDPSVFLADFGIARPLDDTSGITTTNMTVGTVAYAAPEQLMGDAIDGRADEYALAATTYHLLTGTQLFPHSNPAVVISRHLNTAPPQLKHSRADLAALDVALHTALAKDPADRYSTCTAFAHALKAEPRDQAALSPDALTLLAPRHQPIFRASSASAGELSHQKKHVTASRRWIIAIAAIAAVLLIGFGAVAAHTLQSSDSVATQTTSPGTQPPVSTAPALPNPAISKSPDENQPTTRPSDVAPTSSEEPEVTSAPSAPSSTAGTDVPPDEEGFLTAVGSLPMYVRQDRPCGDACLLDQGYKACQAFDQYPNDSQRATRVIYPRGNDVYGSITMDGDMYMLYSANYLCPRHAHLYANY